MGYFFYFKCKSSDFFGKNYLDYFLKLWKKILIKKKFLYFLQCKCYGWNSFHKMFISKLHPHPCTQAHRGHCSTYARPFGGAMTLPNNHTKNCWEKPKQAASNVRSDIAAKRRIRVTKGGDGDMKVPFKKSLRPACTQRNRKWLSCSTLAPGFTNNC